MKIKGFVGIAGLVIAVVAASSPAYGVNIYVNSSTDLPDADFFDGVCATTAGSCSLRAAVQHANYTAGSDTIRFTGSWTHHVATPLEVFSIIIIEGEGNDGSGTTITGDNSSEVFQVQSPPTQWNPVELTIMNARIEDGRRNITVQPDAALTLMACYVDGGSAGLGGGLYAEDADISISQSWIVGNHGSNGGGGIYFTASSSSDDLYVAQTHISNNTAGGDGAGISMVSNGSTLTLTNSRLESNLTISGDGGGVFSQNSKVWLRRSTVDQNTAQRGGGLFLLNGTILAEESSIWDNLGGSAGGGLYLTSIQGEMPELINTTISGNSTLGNGGGIFVDTTGEFWKGLVISNCTITGNIADSDINNAGDGGGLYRSGTYDIVVMHNSILAGNSDLSQSGLFVPDCSGRLNGSYNVIGIATSLCELVGTQTGVQSGTIGSPIDPRLGARTDEPYSAYHPVLADSLAVDFGNPAGCTEYDGTPIVNDQLLELRPYGRACDAGSIESPWTVPPTLEVSINGAVSGTVTSSPGGIDCPGDCLELFDLDEVVTLTATPANSYYDYFDGWTGDADCSDGVVTMSDDRNCTAWFQEHPTHQFTLGMPGTGGGTVVLDLDHVDIPCTGPCGINLVVGESFPMLPTPDPGSVFVGFSGDPDCADGNVTMNSDVSCVATFNLAEPPIFADDFENGDTGAWDSVTP